MQERETQIWIDLTLDSRCVQGLLMERAEWMYKIPRAGNDLTFLHHVTKFVAVAKKHRTSLGREGTICPCNRCKNNLVYEDSVVKSHLIAMVLSRITPSGSFMVKWIRAPPVHQNETRRR